jgi:hypothetical protein
MNEDTQMYMMYAKMIGIAGDMLCHSQGAEKMKKSIAGSTTITPVPMLIGRCRVF